MPTIKYDCEYDTCKKKSLILFFCSFFLIFGCLYPLTFLGVDFTDCGYHVSNQQALFHGVCVNRMCFISDWIGAIWQFISPYGKSLHWCYLGGITIWALCGGFIALILQQLFKLPSAMIILSAFFAILSIPISQLDLLIHYYTLPMLLTTLYCLVITKIFTQKRNNLYVFSLGLLSALLISARFPLILFFTIPLLLHFFDLIFNVNNKLSFRKILIWSCGFMIGITVCFVLYKIFATTDVESQGISIIYTIKNCCQTVLWILSSWGSSFLLLIIVFACYRLKNRKISVVFIPAGILFFAIVFYCVFVKPQYLFLVPIYYLPLFLNGIGAGLILFLFCNVLRENYFLHSILKVDQILLLKLAFVFVIVSYLFIVGTNTGSRKVYYLLPITLAIIYSLFFYVIHSTKQLWPIIFIVPILSIGVICTALKSYRETDKIRCNTQIDVPTLTKIMTSKERAQDIENTFNGIIGKIPVQSEMYVTDNNFLWNYIFDILPYGDWCNDYVKYEQVIKNKLPQNIMIIKKSARNIVGYKEHLIFIKQQIIPQKYTLIFKNDYAEFYSLKN